MDVQGFWKHTALRTRKHIPVLYTKCIISLFRGIFVEEGSFGQHKVLPLSAKPAWLVTPSFRVVFWFSRPSEWYAAIHRFTAYFRCKETMNNGLLAPQCNLNPLLNFPKVHAVFAEGYLFKLKYVASSVKLALCQLFSIITIIHKKKKRLIEKK